MVYETESVIDIKKWIPITSQHLKQHMIPHLIIIKAAEGFISICHAQNLKQLPPHFAGSSRNASKARF